MQCCRPAGLRQHCGWTMPSNVDPGTRWVRHCSLDLCHLHVPALWCRQLVWSWLPGHSSLCPGSRGPRNEAAPASCTLKRTHPAHLYCPSPPPHLHTLEQGSTWTACPAVRASGGELWAWPRGACPQRMPARTLHTVPSQPSNTGRSCAPLSSKNRADKEDFPERTLQTSSSTPPSSVAGGGHPDGQHGLACRPLLLTCVHLAAPCP